MHLVQAKREYYVVVEICHFRGTFKVPRKNIVLIPTVQVELKLHDAPHKLPVQSDSK